MSIFLLANRLDCLARSRGTGQSAAVKRTEEAKERRSLSLSLPLSARPFLSFLSLALPNTHSVRKSFQERGSLSLPALATPVRCSSSSCLTCFCCFLLKNRGEEKSNEGVRDSRSRRGVGFFS